MPTMNAMETAFEEDLERHYPAGVPPVVRFFMATRHPAYYYLRYGETAEAYCERRKARFSFLKQKVPTYEWEHPNDDYKQQVRDT